MRRISASLGAGALVAALAWSSGLSFLAIALDSSPGVADLVQDLNQIFPDSRLTIARAGRGVKVHGRTVPGAAPEDAKELAARESMPLSELLVTFMKLSNNIHAEILIKAMGSKVTGQGT